MRKPKESKKAGTPLIFSFMMAVLFWAMTSSYSSADFNSCAVDWNLFNKPTGFIAAYTSKGQIIRDTEARNGMSDPSHGPANVPPDGTDLASGATSANNPGPYATTFFGYYDGGTPYDRNNPSTMTDDVIFFRVRVAGDPRTSSKTDFTNYDWNILLDVDADGYKEYWLDLEGNYSQKDTSGNYYDRFSVLYDNSNNQAVSNPDAPGVRVNYFSAYNAQDTGSSCQFGRSHTRAYPVNDGTGDWYIEEQLPMTAFKDSNGNQILFPDSPVAFVWSTGASNQDPLQKDWMMDLTGGLANWTDADPIVFGDIVIPDGQPIARFTDSAMNFTNFYTIGSNVYVYVKDPFANTNDNSIEQIQVTVSDPQTGDDEALTLTETLPGSGIFSNAGGTGLPTVQSDGVFNNSDNNGSLEVKSGDTIYVTYTNRNAITVTDQAMVGDSCSAFIQFTRANGLPSSQFILTNSTSTSDQLYVTVTSPSANTNPSTLQNINVVLTGNDLQQMGLTETGNNTGVFRNTAGLQTEIQVDFPAIANDNLWEDNDGGTVTATYSYTCGGQQHTASTTAQLFVTGSAGRVSFTNGAGTQNVSIYTPGQPVFVKVADSTACPDPDGTLPVVVSSSSGDSETLHLVQTFPGSGVYVNTVSDLATTAGSATVTSASSSFTALGLQPGAPFVIATGPDAGTYSIANVNSATSLTLTTNLTSSGTGIGFTAKPLMTATFTGSNTTNNGILTAANGDTLTATYHDCNDGDNVSSNDNKTATATFNTPPVLINEVLFWPDPSTCQTEYIELYNASTQPVDVTGYTVTDGDQFTYIIPRFSGSDITLGPGNKIYISIYDIVPSDKFDSATGTYYLFAPEAAKTGIFPSDELGDPGAPNSADQADQISLYNSSNVIIDYVAWSNTNTPSTDFLSDFAPAVAQGIWQDGAYVSTIGMDMGQAIKRVTDGFDTNSPSDWTFTGTSTVCQTIITRTVISSFEAHTEEGRMVVKWETASEVGTAGFNLLRLDSTTGTYTRINNALLPALISSPQGGQYQLIDAGASTTEPNTYMLDEVEGNGRHITYGPFTAGETAAGNATPPAGSSPAQGAKTYMIGNSGTTVVTDAPSRHGITLAAEASLATGKVMNEVSGYSRAPHALRARSAAAATDRAATGVPVSGNGIVKIAVEQDGLYYLGLSDIAQLLGIPTARAKALLASGAFSLSNRGTQVAYTPARERSGLYFYGLAIDSPYTKDNIYLLTATKGLRMTQTGGSGTNPVQGDASFTEKVHFEQNVFAATAYFTDPVSDYWFWDYIVSGYPGMDTKSFTLHVDGVSQASAADSVTINLQGATDTGVANDHHAVISLNGTVIGESVWQGLSGDTVTLSFAQNLLKEGDNTIEISGNLDANIPYSIFYVNWFNVSYQRIYSAVGNKLLFGTHANSPVTVSGFTNKRIMLFDVTNPSSPRKLTGGITGGKNDYSISFMPSSGAGSYLAITEDAAASAKMWPETPSNLRSRSNSADYLIITTAELKDAAQSLATYRRGAGLSSTVVLQENIMDEFNYGIYDPNAVSAFLSYAYHYWSKAPGYVLLAGNGTYDYKDYLGYGDNLVPPAMAGTPDGLFASDNHFADITGDHVPRMAVGRLPVKTAQEMQDAVTKIINYETAGEGAWEKQVLFTADYPESDGDFTTESDALASLMPPAYSVQKVYLSNYSPADAHSLLLGALSSGAVLLNYEGHAGLDRLSQYGLLLTSDVSSMSNAPMLPVVAAMTCVVGQFDIPGYDTLAKVLVTQPGGGAIAVWSSTGMSKDSLANVLDTSFIGSSFIDGTPIIGNAILKAYSDYADAGNEPFMIDIYSLLGDPALRIRGH